MKLQKGKPRNSELGIHNVVPLGGWGFGRTTEVDVRDFQAPGFAWGSGFISIYYITTNL